MIDGVAVGAQRAHEVRQQRKRIVERIKLDDLAADVHVDADNTHAFELGGARIHFAGAADRNAEFVLGLASRDLGVSLGINVGIDADRDVGGTALAGCDLGEQFQFGFGFDVDAEDALLNRKRQFTRGFADAGEHDLVRRDTGGTGAQELAPGYDVGAGAEPRQRCDHGLIGIGLHRVANQRIDVGEGPREHPIMPLERRA